MRMAIVMISTTMKPASLMEEIAVDLMLMINIAFIVNVLNEKGKVKIQQHQKGRPIIQCVLSKAL